MAIALLGLDELSRWTAATLMQRYLLFTYYVGRPLGGMKDYLESFESLAEALENLIPEANRYYQVVDGETLGVVKEGLAMFKDCCPDQFRSWS